MAIDEIKKICVSGRRHNGNQIALQCATHKYDVYLVETFEEILHNAKERIREILKERVDSGEIPSESMKKALSKIRFTTDLEKAAVDADFVIEAVYEDVEVKRQVFGQLDRICPARAQRLNYYCPKGRDKKK